MQSAKFPANFHEPERIAIFSVAVLPASGLGWASVAILRGREREEKKQSLLITGQTITKFIPSTQPRLQTEKKVLQQKRTHKLSQTRASSCAQPIRNSHTRTQTCTNSANECILSGVEVLNLKYEPRGECPRAREI